MSDVCAFINDLGDGFVEVGSSMLVQSSVMIDQKLNDMNMPRLGCRL